MDLSEDREDQELREETLRIGRRVASYQDEALTQRATPTSEERLRAIRRRERAPRGHAKRRVFMGFAACFVAAMAFLWVYVERPLSYEVRGREGVAGDWVAPMSETIALDFSDGSKVDVRDGGRARVTELSRHGAAVLLERGSLHVRIVPRGGNAWSVVAGPFRVHVVGTEFDVDWDADLEALTVVMQSGHVRLEGPCVSADARDLIAPARTRLSCKAPPSATWSSSAAPHAEVPAPPPSSAGEAPKNSGAPPIDARPSEWRAKLKSRQLGEAFAEARVAGIDSVLSIANGDELVELGSGARLAGDPRTARRLYLSARERFQHSDSSATAAYHLGRMAFDGNGAWAEAESWFAVYLSERPQGALAPEALGRSIECASKLQNGARATELAAKYLATYPNGAHATLARQFTPVDGN